MHGRAEELELTEELEELTEELEEEIELELLDASCARAGRDDAISERLMNSETDFFIRKEGNDKT